MRLYTKKNYEETIFTQKLLVNFIKNYKVAASNTELNAILK